MINTDIVGRHQIGTGSSPQAVMTALIAKPLKDAGMAMTDIDKYSVEMQNPEITKPAGAGNVPESNYKMIAALAVKEGQLERTQLLDFVKEHGMTGFAPTQGHIPSGVPFLGFGRDMIMSGEINNFMMVGKGSLFLGRMTNLFDGLSFVVQKNTGKQAAQFDEAQVKQIVAQAMRDVAENLLNANK
jgi:betaine reductase